ncbi:MAG: hypothetical protein NT077_03915 [Candidatus Taylorbacteria bacterium]|nr:hypothetical protein [Candidatus Taylorbacteria bacterium]
MKIVDIFKKKEETKETGHFAEFFRSATPKEQVKILTKAAELANKDQRKLMSEVDAG